MSSSPVISVSLASCIVSAKSLHLSEVQFSYKIGRISLALLSNWQLCRYFKKRMYVKHLAVSGNGGDRITVKSRKLKL